MNWLALQSCTPDRSIIWVFLETKNTLQLQHMSMLFPLCIYYYSESCLKQGPGPPSCFVASSRVKPNPAWLQCTFRLTTMGTLPGWRVFSSPGRWPSENNTMLMKTCWVPSLRHLQACHQNHLGNFITHRHLRRLQNTTVLYLLPWQMPIPDLTDPIALGEWIGVALFLFLIHPIQKMPTGNNRVTLFTLMCLGSFQRTPERVHVRLGDEKGTPFLFWMGIRNCA